jgi:hypothetical protein
LNFKFFFGFRDQVGSVRADVDAARSESSRGSSNPGKSGFCAILRQGKHIVMTDGVRKITIPRHNRVNAITMGGIVRDAGLTIDEFRKLL